MRKTETTVPRNAMCGASPTTSPTTAAAMPAAPPTQAELCTLAHPRDGAMHNPWLATPVVPAAL